MLKWRIVLLFLVALIGSATFFSQSAHGSLYATKCEIRIPVLYFKNNSDEFVYPSRIQDDWLHPDSVIAEMVRFLKPLGSEHTLVICGTCDSKEKNKKQLVEKRINKVKDILVKQGIPELLIKMKSQLDSLPHFSEAEIMDALKTEGEAKAELLRADNRTVFFRLIKTGDK